LHGLGAYTSTAPLHGLGAYTSTWAYIQECNAIDIGLEMFLVP